MGLRVTVSGVSLPSDLAQGMFAKAISIGSKVKVSPSYMLLAEKLIDLKFISKKMFLMELMTVERKKHQIDLISSQQERELQQDGILNPYISFLSEKLGMGEWTKDTEIKEFLEKELEDSKSLVQQN